MFTWASIVTGRVLYLDTIFWIAPRRGEVLEGILPYPFLAPRPYPKFAYLSCKQCATSLDHRALLIDYFACVNHACNEADLSCTSALF
jgi:hypothetical protein